MSNQNESTQKLPYGKPQLRTIELYADEVLSVGCKLTSGGSAFGASPCTLNFCSQGGS